MTKWILPNEIYIFIVLFLPFLSSKNRALWATRCFIGEGERLPHTQPVRVLHNYMSHSFETTTLVLTIFFLIISIQLLFGCSFTIIKWPFLRKVLLRNSLRSNEFPRIYVHATSDWPLEPMPCSKCMYENTCDATIISNFKEWEKITTTIEGVSAIAFSYNSMIIIINCFSTDNSNRNRLLELF